MTFFGHEGTKTGIPQFALVIFFLAINLISLDAHAFGGTGVSGADTAATFAETTMAQATMAPPPGSTTPPTVAPFVNKAESAFYAGQMGIRAVSPYTEYRIRPDLTLEVTRTYTATIIPQLENTKLAHLDEGWYLLRFLVMLPNIEYSAREEAGLGGYMSEDDRFVAHTDVLAEYKAGKFVATFKMVLPDITRGSIRCDLYTKIVPIDQKSVTVVNRRVDPFTTGKVKPLKSKLVPLVPVGQFTPMDDTNEPAPSIPDPRKPNPIAEHIDEVIARIEAKLKDLDANPIVDEFAYVKNPKMGNLRFVDWTSDQPGAITPTLQQYKQQANADVAQYILQLQPSYVQPMPDQFDPYFARAICLDIARLQGVSFSYLQSWFLRCRDNPYYYLNIHKNIHVRTMDTYGTRATPYKNFTAQMISNFSYNTGESADMGVSFSLSPTNLFPLTGLKAIPISFGASTSNGINNSNVKSGISQAFKSFNVSQYIAKIPIERYRVCVTFEINSEHFYGAPIRSKGLYICDHEISDRPVTVKEGYYLGVENTMGDKNFTPQAVNILFRGDRDIDGFLSHSEDYTQIIQSEPVRVGAAFDGAQEIYHNMGFGAIPGIISLPMAPYSHIQWKRNPGTPAVSLKRAWNQNGGG